MSLAWKARADACGGRVQKVDKATADATRLRN